MKLVIFDFAGTIDSNKELEKDIIESIKNLSNKYNLAIISSTSSSYIKNYLENKNIIKDFSDVLGAELFISKTGRIRKLLEKYNISPQDVVYITDTLGDILEAKNCGIKSIAVTWGLDDRKTLGKGDPKVIVDDPRKLISAIGNALVS